MILIVDDEPSALVMLEMVLARDNHVVRKARSGREALRLLGETGDERCALVITDIRMPVMDGREFVAQLRADPRLASIPVIMCTSTTDRSTVIEMIGQGVRDFVVKPIKAPMVLSKVRAILANGEPVIEPRPDTIERLGMDGLSYAPLATATALTIEIIGDDLAEALRVGDARAVRSAAEQVNGPASIFGARRVMTAAQGVLAASPGQEIIRLAAILASEIDELRAALERVGRAGVANVS